jgi:hypothetical protein
MQLRFKPAMVGIEGEVRCFVPEISSARNAFYRLLIREMVPGDAIRRAYNARITLELNRTVLFKLRMVSGCLHRRVEWLNLKRGAIRAERWAETARLAVSFLIFRGNAFRSCAYGEDARSKDAGNG